MVLLKEYFKMPYFLAIFGGQKSDGLYDYDTLFTVWMNQMKIERGAEF